MLFLILNWIKSFEFDANSATNRVNIYNHLIYVFENGIPTDADFQSYDKYVTNYSERIKEMYAENPFTPGESIYKK